MTTPTEGLILPLPDRDDHELFVTPDSVCLFTKYDYVKERHGCLIGSADAMADGSCAVMFTQYPFDEDGNERREMYVHGTHPSMQAAVNSLWELRDNTWLYA